VSALLRLYPALGHPAYRLLWLGMLPATLAVMMNQVAGPYAAFTLSDSAAVLGVVSLAQGLPMLLLGLVGGVAADRLPRRWVLIASQTTLGMAAAVIAAFALTGGLQVWHVVAASFFQGASFAFNMPARQAYIAELVSRQLLANAVALNNAGQNFCRVAGPALAGVLLAIPGAGIAATFLTIAAMYGIALGALFKLPAKGPSATAAARVGSRSQLTEGLRYARSSSTIQTLILMNLVIVVLGMPYQTLMPVFAERVFSVGAGGLGVLMAGSGVGALAGAVTVAGLSRFRRPAALQLGLGVALGLALIGFAITPWFPLAVALLVLVGFLFSAFSALNNTLLMANTEPRLTGRIMSLYLLTWAAMPVGAVPLAWLAEQAGAPLAIGLAGALVAAIVAGLALLHPPSHRIGWATDLPITHREPRRTPSPVGAEASLTRSTGASTGPGEAMATEL
jgi:MFS family permease